MEEEQYKLYLGGIVAQLKDHYPDSSFMVLNFREGDTQSQISDILNDMTVMDYPCQHQGCPLLPLKMVRRLLRSSESWLSLDGKQNVLLMHCERGGWPVLAFMLAAFLLYKRQYSGEHKTLEMVYNQSPRELLPSLSALNPYPSQLRYLQYIKRRKFGVDRPPLILDCLMLRAIPLFEGGKGCRPIVRVYGQDPSNQANRTSKLLCSTIRQHVQEECMLVKVDVRCRVQGDVVIQCVHLDEDLQHEQMMFRVMFHTAFVRGNALMLSRDDIDIVWDAKNQFSQDFRAEVLFADADTILDDSESATPEEVYEVDALESKGKFDSHKTKKSSELVFAEVVTEDVDYRVEDVKHKQNRKFDSNVDAVKDIAIDDVKFGPRNTMSDVRMNEEAVFVLKLMHSFIYSLLTNELVIIVLIHDGY
ncbi:Formin-like protein 20 [Linum grandiflorum]